MLLFQPGMKLKHSYVVKDFLPYCKSVIVMDNLSSDGTAEIARKSGAVVYSEKLVGYGDAIKDLIGLNQIF